jgi:hypothetical protein
MHCWHYITPFLAYSSGYFELYSLCNVKRYDVKWSIEKNMGLSAYGLLKVMYRYLGDVKKAVKTPRSDWIKYRDLDLEYETQC